VRLQLSILVLAVAACGSRTGAERGPCYGNGTCNQGLVCLSDTCVAPAGPETDAGTLEAGILDAEPARSCPAAENQLTGSIGEVLDIHVDGVRVRRIDVNSVAVEFRHGNDIVAKVTADVSAFVVGVEIPLGDGSVRRITSPDTAYPTSVRGMIRFDAPLTPANSVGGCFSAVFNQNDGTQRTLDGGFRATMEGQ